MSNMNVYLEYKRWLLLFLSLVACRSLTAGVYNPDNIPIPENGDHPSYISNPDGILSDSICRVVNDKLFLLEDSTGIKTLVIVVEHIEGDDPYQFSMSVGNKYGIGSKDSKGLVITLATLDRSYQILTGRGLEGDLPDAVCYRIAQNQMVPHLKNEAWGDAVVSAVQTVCGFFYHEDEIVQQYSFVASTPTDMKETEENDESLLGLIFRQIMDMLNEIPLLIRIPIIYLLLRVLLYLPNAYYCMAVGYRNIEWKPWTLLRWFLYCFNWIWNIGFSLYYMKEGATTKQPVAQVSKKKKKRKEPKNKENDENRVYYVDNRKSFFRGLADSKGGGGSSGGGYSGGGGSSSGGGSYGSSGGGSFGGGGYGGRF